MKKALLILTAALMVSVVAFSQKNIPAGEQGEVVPGEIIVMFEKSMNPEVFASRHASVAGFKTGLTPVKQLSKLSNIYLFRFNELRGDGEGLVAELSRANGVKAAQLNHYVADRSTPNDPSFSQQWHHIQSGDHDIDSDLAWDITTGGTTANGHQIVVAVLEGGGSDWDHTDIVENHWVNSAEIPNNNIDDDGNGYVDDYNGWNTTTNSDGISAGGHGTAVSGMIGAKGNNSQGGAGVNWDVGIMQVQMGGLTESNVIAAYSYPHTMRDMFNQSNGAEGAFVVATNASWGIDLANPANYPVWCAYYDDLGASGILNCGATSNSAVNVDVQGDMPTGCSSDYMVTVTATNSSDVRTFSGYGATTIDLAAPGESVYLPSGSSSYSSTSGTSFATPCVAGAIALVYSIPCSDLASNAISSPQATADLVRGFILDGVDAVSQLTTETVTGGRLNAFNSVTLAMSSCNTDLGCTDSSACNYSPDAIEDDGSCMYFDDCMVCGGDNSTCTGCTNSAACNYDAENTIDDGSCVYGEGISIYVGGGTYDNEIAWTLNLDGVQVAAGVAEYQELCLGSGCYELFMTDSWGDGWNGATYSIVDLSSGNVIFTGDLDTASNGDGNVSGSDYISLGDASCGLGCTDASACNYDSNATLDDGSCDYNCLGCTDPNACNYDATAIQDDGSCLQFDDCGECGGDNSGCLGCTDPSACNYDADALIDDGSCIIGGTSVVITVTTDTYFTETSWQITNLDGVVAEGGAYDATATFETTVCLEDGCYTFTIEDSFGDGICCAYGDGSYSIVVDGVSVNSGGEFEYNESTVFCIGDSETGCTDPAACNYNTNADIDDESCTYDCFGCTDSNACNYDEFATMDDGSCTYPDEVMGCNCEQVVNIQASLLSGESSEAAVVDASGLLESVIINLDWVNTTGGDSWVADAVFVINMPDGSCVEFGGYNMVTGACTSLGDYLVYYPTEWSTAASGTYSAEIDLLSEGLIGEGEWSVSIYNGYTLSEGAEYNASITLVGLCPNDTFNGVEGCTDELACNYNAEANVEDGSCEYAEPEYDCDGNCLEDLDGNGICDYLDILGCMDDSACNYSADATSDDGSCEWDSCGCPEDVNNDGVVTVADILMLLGNFGCVSDCSVDVNGDDATNVQDILLLLAAFGNEC